MDKKWMGLADLIAYGSEKEIIQNLDYLVYQIDRCHQQQTKGESEHEKN